MSDATEIQVLQQRLQHFADKLEGLAGQYGQARQCREYDSDRRKTCLAKNTLPFLEAGDSATAAETRARCSDGYRKEMGTLAKQLESAESVIAQWSAVQAQFEAARSILSANREAMRL